MESTNYEGLKNDALKFIRSYNINNTNKEEVKGKLDNLMKAVAQCPLSDRELLILMTTFMKNIDNFKENNFERFLLCCIPETKISDRFSCPLVEWLLDNYMNSHAEKKCIILIKWLNSMINNNTIDKSDLDVYYPFLYSILKHDYLNVLCPLLFAMSDYGNTMHWMVEKVNCLKQLNDNNKYLNILLKKITLNEMKSNVSGNCLVWPFSSGHPILNKMLNLINSNNKNKLTLLTYNNIIKNDDNNRDLMNEDNTTTDVSVIPLTQIQSPQSFVDFFNCISLPKDIQTLLVSDLAIMRVALDPEMEMEFITKLQFKLSDMFMNSKKNNKYKECEKKSILQHLYEFQNLIHQGIDCVSNFLVHLLQTWNGLDYKEEILNLCEWFVFSSINDLSDDFLKPLHLFFMTEGVQNKRLYIKMYSKFYKNLLMESNKDQPRLFRGFENNKCEWVKDETESREIFTSISKFILAECSMVSLYSDSTDRINLLTESLDFCLNAICAEHYYNKTLLTMIPKWLVYMPLFSPSLRNISSVCYILDKYKQFQSTERLYGLFEDEFNVIMGYIEDYVNFLWKGTGWEDRLIGEVFQYVTDEQSLRGKYTRKQLNKELHFRHHIAIVMLSHQILKNLNINEKDLTDEVYLDSILQSLSPTLVSFIKTYRED